MKEDDLKAGRKKNNTTKKQHNKKTTTGTLKTSGAVAACIYRCCVLGLWVRHNSILQHFSCTPRCHLGLQKVKGLLLRRYKKESCGWSLWKRFYFVDHVCSCSKPCECRTNFASLGGGLVRRKHGFYAHTSQVMYANWIQLAKLPSS